MHETADFFDCYHRFQRLEEVFRLGLAEHRAAPRADLAAALAEVRDEAIRVAETALRVGAEADLWQVVDGASGLWARLGELVAEAADAGIGPLAEVRPVRRLAQHLVDLQQAAATVDEQLAELGAHPDDHAADAGVKVAIAELLACGCRIAVGALEASTTHRLDAAVAVLTATAAAAGRAERDRLRLRRPAT